MLSYLRDFKEARSYLRVASIGNCPVLWWVELSYVSDSFSKMMIMKMMIMMKKCFVSSYDVHHSVYNLQQPYGILSELIYLSKPNNSRMSEPTSEPKQADTMILALYYPLPTDKQ